MIKIHCRVFSSSKHHCSFEKLPIFDLLQKIGDISEKDMYNTFNMGIGMAIIVSREDVQKSMQILQDCGEKAYIIGEIIEGNKEVHM